MTATDRKSVFENRDERLLAQVSRVAAERRASGLEELVGDLECLHVNTEPDRLKAATAELLAHTGYRFREAFETPSTRSCVLVCPGSADLLLQTRLQAGNPFAPFNRHPKSAHRPHTRLETLVFACSDVRRYVALQRRRGTVFMTPEPVETDRFRFMQTVPSSFTGNSVGVIEWRGARGAYRHGQCSALDWQFEKPARPYLARIGTLDHVATRVRAGDRDPAILEFMGLTNYTFDLALHVPELNSITNVARLADARFAQVFTSGLHVPDPTLPPGPTEQFVANYGPRVHHMAFLTSEIEATDRALRADGLEFLSALVGDVAGGIKQSFSAPSPETLLVTEYIKRYGVFAGFFTQHNVNLLTLATAGQ